jgi:hypothetical protein
MAYIITTLGGLIPIDPYRVKNGSHPSLLKTIDAALNSQM